MLKKLLIVVILVTTFLRVVPTSVPFGTPFNFTGYRFSEGWRMLGDVTYEWIHSPATGLVIYDPPVGPHPIDFTNDIPNHRLLFKYGPHQGMQYSDSFGSFVTYDDDLPTTPCFFSNYTYVAYDDNLKTVTSTNAFLSDAELFDFTLFAGMFRDPSTCDGVASVTWTQDWSGRPVTYYFSSIYNATFEGTQVPTQTNYQYHLKRPVYDVNDSTEFWTLPANCQAGSHLLFPLCAATLPHGWVHVMENFHPYGIYV
jgi:hypothetical protein